MTYRRLISLASLLLLASPLTLPAQAVPAEKADQARIDKLLGQMTLEEKMGLIRGASEPAATNQGQAGYLPGVPRLGVPSLRLADGPPGLLTRVPGQAETATMGVAATFSRHDAEINGAVIGREARALGIDVVLQPFINFDRDITFARAYNTFGEDPFLTGQMGAAEIRGAQAQGVMAQAKHFIAYDSDSFNIDVDPQTLHEVYLAPFAEAVQAGVSSIMCSYNRINGPFACGNPDTLKTMLRDELGFKGFVTSDWGGVHSAQFLNQGLDMEMPGEMNPESPLAAMVHTFFRTSGQPAAPATKPNEGALAGMLGGAIPEERTDAKLDLSHFPRDSDAKTLHDALAEGTISEARVTEAARRVLYEMDRFGYLDGKQKHTVTKQAIEANAADIEKTAEDAAVLLKNDGAALPLKPADLSSLALIGPTAGQVDAIGTFGERSPGLTARQVGPLDALRRSAPGAKIAYAVEDDMSGTPVPAAALSHGGKPGLLRSSASGGSSADATLNFTLLNSKALPAESELTWKGELTVPSAGEYWLYLQVLGGRGMLSVDGKELSRTSAAKGVVHGDVQHATQDNVVPTIDGLDNVRRAVTLTAGAHSIEVTLSPDTSHAPAQIRLAWYTPDARERDHAAAIAAARAAKTAVVFAWTRGKQPFVLPGGQDALIEEVATANPNTIVVLNTSQPVAMPWLPRVKAVLEMWWPGDEGGAATAKLLLGKSNPGGHLPFTWGKQPADYPAGDPAHPERSAKGVDEKTTYSEGLLIGYRWFDAHNIEPLYPFGYGLSYTQFKASELKAVPAADGSLSVTVRVANTGTQPGDAVPQLYLDAPDAKVDGVQFAPRTLVGFDRVTLAPGESRVVSLKLAPRTFEYWSPATKAWVRSGGARRLHAGFSEADLALSTRLP